jgi:hypothetical protein
MSIFSFIKTYFYRSFINAKMASGAIVRQPSNFERARMIGILVEATSETNRAAAMNYAEALRKGGKTVDIRGFVSSADPVDNYPFKTWNKKNLTWAGYLTEEAAGQFWNTQYDILINLYTEPCAALEGVSALSRAHFRVGAFHEGKTDYYDLMIDIGSSTDLKSLIGQVDFYMKQVNK